MPDDTSSIEDRLSRLEKEHPVTPHTGIGRLTTTIRRMRAEKEMGIPIHLRFGSMISAKTGKGGNAMTEAEWNEFYEQLCENLKRDYPGMYFQEFPGSK
jgi:hypothetical protein